MDPITLSSLRSLALELAYLKKISIAEPIVQKSTQVTTPIFSQEAMLSSNIPISFEAEVASSDAILDLFPLQFSDTAPKTTSSKKRRLELENEYAPSAKRLKTSHTDENEDTLTYEELEPERIERQVIRPMPHFKDLKVLISEEEDYNKEDLEQYWLCIFKHKTSCVRLAQQTCEFNVFYQKIEKGKYTFRIIQNEDSLPLVLRQTEEQVQNEFYENMQKFVLYMFHYNESHIKLAQHFTHMIKAKFHTVSSAAENWKNLLNIIDDQFLKIINNQKLKKQYEYLVDKFCGVLLTFKNKAEIVQDGKMKEEFLKLNAQDIRKSTEINLMNVLASKKADDKEKLLEHYNKLVNKFVFFAKASDPSIKKENLENLEEYIKKVEERVRLDVDKAIENIYALFCKIDFNKDFQKKVETDLLNILMDLRNKLIKKYKP